MSSKNLSVIGDAAYISIRIEHAETVASINKIVSENRKRRGHSIILINGAESSGKTVLAKVLTSRAKGSIYFDGTNVRQSEESHYYGKAMNRLTGSYVIDDAHKADSSELKNLIRKVVDGGGSIILFSKNLFTLNINQTYEKFSLTHSGLIEVKYSRAI